MVCLNISVLTCVGYIMAYLRQSNETEGACDASEGSPEATCAVCLTSAEIDLQVGSCLTCYCAVLVALKHRASPAWRALESHMQPHFLSLLDGAGRRT